MKGKLAVLESLDGAGKSTQIKEITKHFDSLNLKYEHLHFPKYGHNEFSEVIAKFLRGEFGTVDEVDPYFVANIYAMDRYLYLPELLQKLEDNDVVLLDRYVFSNLAFQGAKYEDIGKAAYIQNWINDFEFEFLELPYPDLTIFLDVIEKRLKDREGEDRNYLKGLPDIHEEDISFQKKVRDVYLSLEGAKNYHIISCVKKDKVLLPEELFDTYKDLLNSILQ